MTPIQRTTNLRKIAHAAVHIERTRGIPAELTLGQCIIESNWLDKCPGNNAFGIKARPNQPFVEFATKEQINGKIINIKDKFAAYPSLDACFEAYADLILNGKYFKPRFEKYLEHRSLELLLTDMSGSDGLPPYFTGAGYVDLWKVIVSQTNVKMALSEARREVTSD